MPLVEDPAPADPGGWVFGVDHLRTIGLEYATPQLELLERVVQYPSLALGVAAVPDPQFIPSPNQLPLFQVDPEQQALDLFVRPVLCDIRPDWGVGPDDDEPWWRFPTVNARELERGYMGDRTLGAVNGVRLWNLWPLSTWDADVVLHEIELWEAEVFNTIMDTYGAVNGELDPCDLLETDRRSHTHAASDETRVWQCVEGGREIDSRISELFHRDEAGDLYPYPSPPPRFSGGLDEVWEQLVATSKVAAFKAAHAVPRWRRDDLLRTERHYSPWLWLS